MAFPAIAATNTSTGASGTSHTVNLPTGIAAGNLLVIVFGGVGAATTTFPADWTRLGGGGTSGTLDVAWKIATGTEGSSIVVTTGATSITSNHKSYRITGGDRVVIGTNVTISSSATADPPSLTPGWWASSQDILWLAISMANTQTTVSTYPTSFSNGAVVTNGSTGLATCDRNVNGTLLDPAAFTWGGTGRKNTNTVAIKPGIVVVPSPEDLENYADSWIAIRTLTQTQTADDLENYADSDTVDKQTAAGGPTPKTVNLTADPWGNLADQQPTIDSRGNLSISLTTDALNNWAEQLAHSKSYALPVDTMTLADQPVIVSQGAALAVSPPADSLNNWADQLAHSKSYALSADSMTLADQPATINLASPNLQANLSADSLQNWADNYSRSQAYNLTGDLMVLADQPVAVSQGGALAVSPPADSLNNWADQLAHSRSYALSADAMTMGDQPPTVDLRVPAITKNLPADSLNSWAEAWVATKTLTGSTTADDLENYADSTTVDKQVVGATAITRNLTGDSMALADKALSLTGDYLLTFQDDVLNLADTAPTVDRQVVSTTPKTAAPPADSLQNWADSSGLGKAYNLTGDLMTMADQPATVAMTGRLQFSLPADSLQNYADPLGRGYGYNLTGDALAYADQPVAVSQAGGKTVAPPADANATYADQVTGLGVAYNLTGDSLAQSDQPPTVAMTARLEFSLSDSMVMADAPVTVAMTAAYTVVLTDTNAAYTDSIQAAAGGDLRYALVPDSFAAYADTLGNSEAFAFFDIWGSLADITQDFFTLAKLYNLTADPWANLGDTAPTIGKTANLAVAPAADAMTMADQPVTVLKLAPKEISLPADSMALADSMRIGWALNFVDDLQNWQDTLQNSIAFRLTDDLNNWQDQPQIAAGGALRPILTADTMAMGDQPVTITLSKPYPLTADQMAMGDTPVAYKVGIVLALQDSLTAYVDALGEGAGYGLSDAMPVYADAAAVQRIGKLIAQLSDINEQYGDWVDPLVLGFDQKIARISDSLANWNDVVEHVRGVYGVHLHGRVVDQVGMNGKSRDEVNLTGKSGAVSVGGSVYSGEL